MKLLIQFIIKELLQFKRDPKLRSTILIAPIMQLILLGYAATLDINVVHTSIYDNDKSFTSRKLIEKYEKSNYFKIEHYIQNEKEMDNLLDNGRTDIVVVIPKDFEKDMSTSKTAKLQILLDATDGNKANVVFGYISSITSGFSNNIALDALSKKGILLKKAGTISAEPRVWYNPELKARNFMLPAICGLLLMLVTTILMSMAIVKEREIGTLEQIIVTPIKNYQYILGKLIPYVFLAYFPAFIALIVIRFWFGIEIRGDFLFLLFGMFLFILSNLGLGMFISTISKTQQQAMMIAFFGIMNPMIYISGFAFPVENMPVFIQYITYVIPLKYFIIIIRGVILKGLGFFDLWQETLALFAIGLAILLAAIANFKKNVD